MVTLPTESNAKLLQKLKPRSKRTIIWNKYQSKVTAQAQNQCLDYLIDPSVQGVNKLFIFVVVIVVTSFPHQIFTR